jgi:hypothetical protein
MKPDGQKRFQPTLPKDGERSFVVEHPFLVVIIGLLLITVAYLGEEEIACRHGGYKRWDVVVNSEKVWFLFNYQLGARTPEVFFSYEKAPRLENLTYFQSCVDEEKGDIAFIDYRDKWIGSFIETPENMSDGRKYGLHKLPFNSLSLIDDVWNDRLSRWIALNKLGAIKEQVPDWLPWDQLNAASFIGSLGSGYLFRGTKPDQYFWVGF